MSRLRLEDFFLRAPFCEFRVPHVCGDTFLTFCLVVFFSRVVNGPEITAAIKPVLGDAYNYDSTVSKPLI